MRSLILAVFLIPSAQALTFDGKSIHLTPDEVMRCQTEGGCAVISRKDFEEAAADIFQQGVMQGSQTCKKTDWRKHT